MKSIYKIFILAFLVRFVIAFIVWHPDLNNHVDWGIRFWQYGPGEFYRQNVWSFSWPNQPPGSIIIFASIRKLYELVFSFFWFLNVNIPAFPSNIMLFFEGKLYQALLKLPAILADLGIAYLIFRFSKLQKKEEIGLWGATAFLVNPAIWYNSSVWGQTDSTVNFFGVLSVLLLIERRIIVSSLSFFISLFIKASVIILAPIILLVALRQRYSLWVWARAVLLPLALIGLLTSPFSGSREPLSWLVALYQDKVFGWQLHLITANAFNLWATITGINERPDTLILGGLMYKTWGYILFTVLLTPLLFKVYKSQDSRTVLWVVMLAFFSSFTLLTGMHERYLYPIFPFLTLIASMERKLLPLLISLSGIYVINLYNFWWYPRMEWFISILSWGDRFLPRVLGLVVTIVFIWLYIYFFRQNTSHAKN